MMPAFDRDRAYNALMIHAEAPDWGPLLDVLETCVTIDKDATAWRRQLEQEVAGHRDTLALLEEAEAKIARVQEILDTASRSGWVIHTLDIRTALRSGA